MRYKGNLVLLELLIALAFFAVSAVIGAGVLARSYAVGRDSRRAADAMFIAQAWAERIAESGDPEALLAASFEKLGGGYRLEEDGYRVEASLTAEAAGAGTLYDVFLTVSREGEALMTLPASRYVPGEVPE